MEKYDFVKDLGAGCFGVAKLFWDKQANEHVAIKFIERGQKVDENVEREIINHRSLRHPNVIRFKELFLTPTHLAMVMEYAAGGELFQIICDSGRFSEHEARYIFQQLISGVSYFHSLEICHRDLKLDNILLDGSPAPRVKICDFGYSKSSLLYSKPNIVADSTCAATIEDLTEGKHDGKLYPLHSTPNTAVGSPTYAAPEVLLEGLYDGKVADVWSCGVTLYIMLVAAYPFEDPNDSKTSQNTIRRIMNVEYKIPDDVDISQDCRDLLSRIFVRNPTRRISPKEIKCHAWFIKKLPRKLTKLFNGTYYKRNYPTYSHQSVEEVMNIVGEARTQLLPSSTTTLGYAFETKENDEAKLEEEKKEGKDDKGNEPSSRTIASYELKRDENHEEELEESGQLKIISHYPLPR